MSAHAIELLARPLGAKIAFFCQTKVGSVFLKAKETQRVKNQTSS